MTGPLSCDTDSITSFDSNTATFTINLDVSMYETYPPGIYSFAITGTIGSIPANELTADYIFEIEMVDLCVANVVLSIDLENSDL